MPEITRNEYLRLLQAAKSLGKERTYFVIKTICCVGIRIGELPQFTVEMLEAGKGEVISKKTCRSITVPKAIRQELLDYARRTGIKSGPVFITKSGQPICRSNINKEIKLICSEAKVPEEKANPRCLWNLHLKTCETIQSNISIWIDQAYEQILNTEQLAAAWDCGA